MRRHYGVTTGRYKLIHYYNIDEWELFDLDEDPEEYTSVYGKSEYNAIFADLSRELKRLQQQLQVPDVDPFPLKR